MAIYQLSLHTLDERFTAADIQVDLTPLKLFSQPPLARKTKGTLSESNVDKSRMQAPVSTEFAALEGAKNPGKTQIECLDYKNSSRLA